MTVACPKKREGPLISDHNPVSTAAAKDVKCQIHDGQMITRVVSEGGLCFKDTIDVLKGTVLSREEVPCRTTCK